jgi:hypothetical protein
MSDQPPIIDRSWDAPGQQPKQQPAWQPSGWIKWVALGLFVFLVVFMGVGLLLPKSSVSKLTPSPAAQGDSSLSVTENDFVRLLGANPKGYSQEQAITEGRQVCDIFASGGVGTEVVVRLQGLGMTTDDAVRVVFAATMAFCPEYTLDAQR